MRGAHDACGAVHIEADVLRWVERRFAGVDPDADADGAGIEFLHRFGHRVDGGLGGGERVEEGVAFVVDLVSVEARARRAHDAAVLGERVSVGVGAELLEQPSGSFNVGEHHRHRPGRLLHHSHGLIFC